MFCYKIISILVFVCLLISLVACLIGALSKDWWCGNFEAIIPFNNATGIPHGYRAHLLFDIHFGLTGMCWGVKQAKLSNDTLPKPLFAPMKKCVTELPDNVVMRELVKKNMIPFRNTLICMIVAIIFTALAFIFSIVKLPCIRLSRRRMLLFTTLILIIIAALACIVALIIADQNMHYDAPFMKTLLSRPPSLGKSIKPFIMAVLAKVFRKVKITDLSDNFSKSVSFDITCVGAAFLILAIILTIFEHCCARKSGDDEYKSELISDGYKFPDGRAETAIRM